MKRHIVIMTEVRFSDIPGCLKGLPDCQIQEWYFVLTKAKTSMLAQMQHQAGGMKYIPYG